MHILIAYGTSLGGTAGVAQILGDALAAAGHTVDVRDCAQRPSPVGYDVVVVGAGLYANRWVKDARDWVKRHRGELSTRPVWLFSSGPLDDSPSKRTIPPVAEVKALANDIGARGHRTFGGRLEEHPRGFIARLMARRFAGDWRNPDDIRAYAASIAQALRATTEAAAPGP